MDGFVRFVQQHHWDIGCTVLFFSSTVCVAKLIIEHNRYMSELQQIKQKKIFDLDDALELVQIQNKKNSQQRFLIKLYPKTKTPFIQVTKELHSNELFIIEPSYKKIVSELVFVSKFGQKFQFKNLTIQPKNLNFLEWSDNLNTIKIKGLGEIIDKQIFEVKNKVNLIKNKNFSKKIWQFIAYFLQKVYFGFKLLRNSKQMELIAKNQDRGPFFEGPVIGSVIYAINFVKNKQIIIEAKIEDGIIFPIKIVSSKNSILNEMNMRISANRFKIVLFSLIGYYCYKFSHRFIQQKIRRLKIKLISYIINSPKIRKLQKLKLDEDKKIKQNNLCIICYTNCRNVLLLNCRHLIICDECKLASMTQDCPLCKNKIYDEKIIMKY